MQPSVRDRLNHMRESILQIERYTSGLTELSFGEDRLIRDAVERRFQIISEASRHVPDRLKELHPNIDWRAIRNFGNVLRHGYEAIETDVVWRTIVEDLPELRAVVEMLLRRDDI
jgi:uncharacterized protein with HEPN domain